LLPNFSQCFSNFIEIPKLGEEGALADIYPIVISKNGRYLRMDVHNFLSNLHLEDSHLGYPTRIMYIRVA